MTIELESFRNYVFPQEEIHVFERVKFGIADSLIYSAQYTPAEYPLVAFCISVVLKDCKDTVKAELGTLFGDKHLDGRVAATWFTGELCLIDGKMTVADSGHDYVYEWGVTMQIASGRVADKENIDDYKDNAYQKFQLVNAVIFSGPDKSSHEHQVRVKIRFPCQTRMPIETV